MFAANEKAEDQCQYPQATSNTAEQQPSNSRGTAEAQRASMVFPTNHIREVVTGKLAILTGTWTFFGGGEAFIGGEPHRDDSNIVVKRDRAIASVETTCDSKI